MEYNMLDKEKLIVELREIHKELVSLYEDIFNYKYDNDEEFKVYIDNEYSQNGISKKDQKSWNKNFCHRASYTLLNKILFVRICEDKGFMRNPEDYIAGEIDNPHIGEKLSKIGLQKWASIIKNFTFGELINFAFLDMRQSYSNIILYKDDRYEILNPTDEELNLKYLDDNKNKKEFILNFERILGNILENLDTEKFNFAKTDSNILGDVYEEFMDRETRKAIGQFYTPEFVIKQILENTVKEADVLENPFLKVADISCGSGHFLIMTYDILKDKFIENLVKLRTKYANETYLIKKNGKEEEITGEKYWIKENIHYHLLKHCIYGADIDSFAIQLTTINLLLKDLDNFTDELNIIECDSLIKIEEDYDWKDLSQELNQEFELIVSTHTNLFGEEEKITTKKKKEDFDFRYVNAFGENKKRKISREEGEEIVKLCKFWEMKFDYMIGNPPYVNVYSLNEKSKTIYSNQNYKFMYMKYDLYILFYERALSKLKKNGKLGFIVPYSFNNQKYGEKLRKWILDNIKINKIIDYSEVAVFDAMVTGCVYILENLKDDKNNIKIKRIKDKIEYYINQNLFLDTPNNMFRIELTEVSSNIILKMKENTKKVEDFCYVSMGAEIHSKENAIDKKRKDERIFSRRKDAKSKRFLEGLDIDKYRIKETSKYIEYIPEIMRRPKFPELFENEKLLVRNVTGKDGIIAAIDYENYYIDCTINCCLLGNQLKGVDRRVLKRQDFLNKEFNDIELLVLLTILNARSTNYFFLKYLGDNLHVNPNDIKKLPVPNLSEKKERFLNKLGLEIVKLEKEKVIREEELFKLLSNKFNIEDIIEYAKDFDQIDSNIDILTSKIDWILYNLYKLNEVEIFDIERSFKSNVSYEETSLLIKRFSDDNIDNTINGNIYEDIFDYELLLNLVSRDITLEKFKKEHIDKGLSLYEISEKCGYKISTIYNLRNKYLKIENSKNTNKKLINIDIMLELVGQHLVCKSKSFFNDNKNFKSLSDLITIFNEKTSNIDDLIKVFRYKDISLSTLDVIKNTLNKDSYTWNAYRKVKDKDSVNKTFIKYYDSNYYGLSEWSDEIHKHYFLDAIEEYTETDPNEKKAKDILKLFKDLDIEDKKDYLSVIEGKINRVFK